MEKSNDDLGEQLGWVYYFGTYVHDYYLQHKDSKDAFIQYIKDNAKYIIDAQDFLTNLNELKNSISGTIASITSMFKPQCKLQEKLNSITTKIDLGVEVGNQYFEEIELNQLINAYNFGKLGRKYFLEKYKQDPDDPFIQYVLEMKDVEFDFENAMKNIIFKVYERADKTSDFIIMVREFTKKE